MGVSVRFWYSVVTPPPPLTIDWSPAVYWLAGICTAALTIGVFRRNRSRLSDRRWWVLLSANSIVLAGYLAVAAALFIRSFSLLG